MAFCYVSLNYLNIFILVNLKIYVYSLIKTKSYLLLKESKRNMQIRVGLTTFQDEGLSVASSRCKEGKGEDKVESPMKRRRNAALLQGIFHIV